MNADSGAMRPLMTRGPRLDPDGLVVGEIELPGGLPPEPDDDPSPEPDEDPEPSA